MEIRVNDGYNMHTILATALSIIIVVLAIEYSECQQKMIAKSVDGKVLRFDHIDVSPALQKKTFIRLICDLFVQMYPMYCRQSMTRLHVVAILLCNATLPLAQNILRLFFSELSINYFVGHKLIKLY